MKNVIIVLGTIFLVACAKSGSDAGGSTAPGRVVDSSPHVYSFLFISSGNATLTVHEVCNFGLPTDFKDFNQTIVLTNAPAGIAGCTAGTKNITLDVTNTGPTEAVMGTTIDGVYPAVADVTLAPGGSYTFQRGF